MLYRIRRQILPAPPSKPSPKKIIQDSNNNQMESKKLAKGLHLQWRPANKPNKKRSQIHSKSYGNIVSLRKTISRAARYRDDPDGNVINLSKHSFTKIQFKVLHKNLNFCPTPGYYNKKEVKTDIKNFERKIKLKSFFELKKQDKPNKNNNTSSDIPNIKAKSIWEPPPKIATPLTRS